MEIMVFAGWSDDGADITNEVKKYQQMILLRYGWVKRRNENAYTTSLSLAEVLLTVKHPI
jgi:hypothetical protein